MGVVAPSRLWTAVVSGVLLVGYGIRLPSLARESYWRDEVDAVLFASVPWAELLASFARPRHNGPAYHLALRLWMQGAGASEFAMRYLSVVGDLLGLVIVVALGRRLGGNTVGALAGGIWAILPAAIWYAREGKMYSCLAALGALCAYLALRGVQKRAIVHGVWALVLAMLGTFLHFFAALLVLSTAVIVVWTARQHRDVTRQDHPSPRLAVSWRDHYALRLVSRRTAGKHLGSVLGVLVVCAVIASLFAAREWKTIAVPAPTGHPFVGIADLGPRILYGVLLNAYPTTLIVPLIILVLPIVISALTLPAEKPQWSRLIVPCLLLGIPIATFYAVSLQLPLFAERYFMFMAPILVVLMARGIWTIAVRVRLLGVVAAIALIALFGWADISQAQARSKADYRALGAFLRESARDGDGLMVVMPYNDRSVRYYAGDKTARVDAPSAPNGITNRDLDTRAGVSVDGYERLWLVRAEADQHDPSGAIERWLAGRSTRQTSKEWLGLRLDLFVAQDSYRVEIVDQVWDASPIRPGETRSATIRLRNSGTRIWNQDGPNPTILATSHWRDRESSFAQGRWPSNSRAARMRESSVEPGEIATFVVPFTPPGNLAPGTYNEYFQLVTEGVTWHNDIGIYLPITVARCC